MAERAKKKTDYAALQSPFMRIPGMAIPAARGLLDVGLREVYELSGRSPETLWEDLRKAKPDAPRDLLPFFRLAVYFAENGTDADPKKLTPAAWQNPS